jgi:hypothetical protein
MELKFKNRAGELLSYFRQHRRGEGQSRHMDNCKDESHLVVEENMQDDQMYSHEILWDIKDHPIVHEWRRRLEFMNRDLSALFAGDGGDGFIHRMAVNKSASGVEKWNAACSMGISVEIRDVFTSSLQANITSYVHKRVSYVLACLCEIRGPSYQYVQYMYVDPWKTLLGPDHIF